MEKVVHLTFIDETIALVTLDDRPNKNMFTKGIMDGISETFDILRSNEKLKVVLIQGNDNYFCSGGTKETLIDELVSNNTTFESFTSYKILLEFELPTIAVMSGHALGGGFAFGCYADLMVMSLESFYATNFMKHGFTPGMGATYIVPEKIGTVLGYEMLYTARNFQGVELKERGAKPLMVKKSEVLERAISLGKDIAQKPLLSLKLLKQQLTLPIKNTLPSIISNELRMHEKSFKLPEVRDLIEKNLGF